MTAHSLQRWCNVPCEITLFEATERVGGKIQTPAFQSVPWSYEAGAAEFYDYSGFEDDPLKELILSLGLTVRPMGGPSVVLNDRILANIDDVRDALGADAARRLAQFDQVAKDQVTPLEFFYSGDDESVGHRARVGQFSELLEQVSDPLVRRYVQVMIHSDLAAEPSQTSLNYGLQNYLMNDSAYMNLYGIEGGNWLLPQRLAEAIDAQIRPEHRVLSIKRDEQGFLLEFERQGQRGQETFDFVIVALPHNQLLSVDYQGAALREAFARHHAFYHYPAHYLRITMLFERPFWRDSLSDSYWMLDAFGGCCLYDESSRQTDNPFGILGWLLGGDSAVELSAFDDESLIERAVDSLPSFLSQGRALLKEAHVHRWLSAVNAMPGGAECKSLEERHCPEPLDHSRLFVVGDYLFDSTLNGVLDSANFVALWIASQLESSGVSCD